MGGRTRDAENMSLLYMSYNISHNTMHTNCQHYDGKNRSSFLSYNKLEKSMLCVELCVYRKHHQALGL